MATGRPSVICVTSGTAAAELHPAVVEAHHARVPLIVCTADRPPELHHTGAPQTIEQVGLFAAATRWSSAPGVPAEGQEATWRPLAVRAFVESIQGPRGPGPVHLNLEFREPLDRVTWVPAAAPRSGGHRRRARALPCSSRSRCMAGGSSSWAATRRCPGPRPRRSALAERLGWPVLADPRSGSRVAGTIAAADSIVRTKPPLPETRRACSVRPWLSRALGEYVSDAAHAGARVVVVDPWGSGRIPTEWRPNSIVAPLIGGSTAAIEGAAPCDPQSGRPRGASREERHSRPSTACSDRISANPQVARAVYRHAARDGATLVVSASMPIRDLEWYADGRGGPAPGCWRIEG